MPSRARNRFNIDKTLVQLHRLFWYRFGIFLADYRPDEARPGGWIYDALITHRASIEEVTNQISFRRSYRDMHLWPVDPQIWNQYVDRNITTTTQKHKGLLL